MNRNQVTLIVRIGGDVPDAFRLLLLLFDVDVDDDARQSAADEENEEADAGDRPRIERSSHLLCQRII